MRKHFDKEEDEFYEDWEKTGQEEMAEIHKECAKKAAILDVRDRLYTIKELVTVCREALSESQLYNIKNHVVNVLYFQVEAQLKIAEEELAKL